MRTPHSTFTKTLLTGEVCMCVFGKCQGWVLGQQVMVFTLKFCVFKKKHGKDERKTQMRTLRVNGL